MKFFWAHKQIIVCLLVLLISSVVEAETRIADIQERGQLIVAMTSEERPPFFQTAPSGQVKGIDVTIAEGIAVALGVALKIDRSAGTFDAVIDRVAMGLADLGISKLSVTLARAQRVRFSEPYAVFNQAVLINRLRLASLQAETRELAPIVLLQAAAVRIGVMAGTSYVDFAKETFPHGEIVGFSSKAELFGAAAAGTIAAVFWDDHEIRMAQKEIPTLGLHTTLVTLYDRPDPLAIAVAPDAVHLAYWIDVYLDQTFIADMVRQTLERERAHEDRR